MSRAPFLAGSSALTSLALTSLIRGHGSSLVHLLVDDLFEGVPLLVLFLPSCIHKSRLNQGQDHDPNSEGPGRTLQKIGGLLDPSEPIGRGEFGGQASAFGVLDQNDQYQKDTGDEDEDAKECVHGGSSLRAHFELLNAARKVIAFFRNFQGQTFKSLFGPLQVPLLNIDLSQCFADRHFALF